MKAFPSEFAELLTPRGRRILEGRDPEVCGILKTGQRFVSLQGAIDVKRAAACRDTLEKALLARWCPWMTRFRRRACWG